MTSLRGSWTSVVVVGLLAGWGTFAGCDTGGETGDALVGPGATVASSSSSGQGGSMTSSSTGNMCSEQPCKLTVPQCGCETDQKCTLNDSDRVCAAAGAIQEGELCNGGCATGLLCVGGQTKTCRTFCSTDADCTAPGGRCVTELSDGNGGVLPDKVCSLNCNPLDGAGCIGSQRCDLFPIMGGGGGAGGAGGGGGAGGLGGAGGAGGLGGAGGAGGGAPPQVSTHFTECRDGGALMQGDLCNDSSECDPQFLCAGVEGQNVCIQRCDVDAPVCDAAGTVCVAFAPPAILDGTNYGGCVPQP